jgi:putative flippase GtrA
VRLTHNNTIAPDLTNGLACEVQANPRCRFLSGLIFVMRVIDCRSILKQERTIQLIRFCAVGGSVGVIDLSVVWITSHLLSALYSVSLGYIIGVICHFLLNKFWVFRCNSKHYRREIAFYLLHMTLYWLMTILTVSLLLPITGNVVVARVISIPPMTLFTFCFLRFVVFKSARPGPNSLRRNACSTVPDVPRLTAADPKAYIVCD